jgi:HK97 family phage major capsid protein
LFATVIETELRKETIMTPEEIGDLSFVGDKIQRMIQANANGARSASPAAQILDGMTNHEIHGVSIVRAVNAILKNDWKNAGLERSVSDTMSKELNRPVGANAFLFPTFLPHQVRGANRSRFLDYASQRAIYQVGTPAQGGNIVGTELLAASFIEVLRNATVTGQLGARFMTGLVGNVDLPRQNSQTSVTWVGESAALTESEATFDKVSLRPHTVGALSKMSRLMLLQSTPAIEQLVRDDLLETSAIAVDAAALFGTGSSSQPLGIINTSGVGAVIGGTNGAALTFDMLVSLYAQPLIANAPMESLGYAFNGKTKGFLATLKASTGQYLWNPTQSIAGPSPNQVLGYKYGISNQLPSNLTKGTSSGICSSLVFGNWQELLIGEWGVTEIMVNPYGAPDFAQGDVAIRAFTTVDVGLRHPASFAIQTDALTPGF